MSGILGAAGRVGALVSAVSNAGNAAGTLVGNIASVLSGNLLGASWNGLPFSVREHRLRRGRRIALHEYPYSNQVWPEDLGRGTRTIAITGFLIGDDVATQRDAWLTAAETVGPGTLIHPTLGTLQVTLQDCAVAERWEAGRVVELELSFVQVEDTKPKLSWAQSLESALGLSADSTLSTVIDGVASAVTTVSSVMSTVSKYVGIGLQLMGDVQRVAGAVEGISQIVSSPESWFGTAEPLVVAVPPLLAPLPLGLSANAQVEAATAALLAASVRSTTVVAQAGAALLATPNGTTLAAYAEAVRAAATDPASAIRMLTALVLMPGTDVLAPLCRCVALVSLARAVGTWTPTSYTEAAAMRGTVCGLFDTEIDAAADAGEGAIYLALRALRAAVVAQINAAGANLPDLITYTFRRPLPALMLAYRLYGTAARTDELVARVQPVHPAFMPTTFQALAS